MVVCIICVHAWVGTIGKGCHCAPLSRCPHCMGVSSSLQQSLQVMRNLQTDWVGGPRLLLVTVYWFSPKYCASRRPCCDIGSRKAFTACCRMRQLIFAADTFHGFLVPILQAQMAWPTHVTSCTQLPGLRSVRAFSRSCTSFKGSCSQPCR